jgi:tetratricopeptide (TPR) repeat protein
MRILAVFVAASLTSVVAAPIVMADTVAGGRETLAEDQPEDRGKALDALFETLRSADDEEAAKAAESSIAQIWLNSGSDTVDLLMDWALEAMDKEDYPHALDLLDRIVTIRPGYAEAWNKRATVHFINDDYGKSIADLERVLALEPRHFGALAGLGTILRELGDEDRALEAYREALTLDPYLEEVEKAIEELESETGGEDI